MKRRNWYIKLGLSAGMLIGLTLAPAAGLEAAAAETGGATTDVQLLGINDFHGALSTTGSAYLKDNEKFSSTGGAAMLAGYLNRSESEFLAAGGENATSIRVQAGDMVGASPANSGLLQDYPTILALNRMKFDIGTLGNHEFDEGLSEFNRILTGGAPSDSMYPIVKEFQDAYNNETSDMEIVVGNVVKKSDNSIPYSWKPYTTREVTVGGKQVKIGFIGVVTTEIPTLVLKEHYEEYNFLDEAETIAKYTKELRADGVNAIVVLAHVPSTSTGAAAGGEAAEIMNKVNTLDKDNSVDVFFAGHNHVYTNGYVGDTLVVQSTSQGKAYSNVTGTLSEDTEDFTEAPSGEIIPVATEKTAEVDAGTLVTPDSDVAQLIAKADETVAEVTGQKIGTADSAEDITRSVNEIGESPVGNLITDGQVYMANKNGLNVDFAMTNNGGIRDDLKVESDGTITWGAAQAVQPFGNIMQVVEMTGAQIRTVLNQQTFAWDSSAKTASGYYLQVSGLKYTVTDKADGSGYEVIDLKKTDGTSLEDGTAYRLVINDFLYGGGDGFSEFTNAKLVDAMQPDTETFVGYIEAMEAEGKKISASIEGRKVYVDDADPGGEDDSAAVKAIKAATTISDYRKGDQFLTGKTIADGTVSVTKGDSTGARVSTPPLMDTADAQGSFKVDVSSLALTETDTIIITISDNDGNEATFTRTVLSATAGSTTEPSGSGSTSDTTGKTTTSSTSGKLPQTGEETVATIASLGILLVAGSTIIYLRRRKHS